MPNHTMCQSRYISPFLAFAFIIFLFSSEANALTVRVGSTDAHPGDQVTVNVTVEDYDQEQIAAAAFTLTYSSDLTLTAIESDFFDTFSNQWNNLAQPPIPLPPTSVTVNSQTYTQPILGHTSTDSGITTTLIAGARVTADTPSTIFTLHFTVNAAAEPSNYPISITPNSISNTDAGYPENGVLIPVLYGADSGETDLTNAFPPYLPAIIGGAINVEMPLTDEDGDGIYDKWEIDHFGNTTIADATSDTDGDGYTDLQEYLNSYYPVETDPVGDIYDPNIKNAPGGTGYNPTDNGSFWLMMLPAILSGGQQ